MHVNCDDARDQFRMVAVDDLWKTIAVSYSSHRKEWLLSFGSTRTQVPQPSLRMDKNMQRNNYLTPYPLKRTHQASWHAPVAKMNLPPPSQDRFTTGLCDCCADPGGCDTCCKWASARDRGSYLFAHTHAHVGMGGCALFCMHVAAGVGNQGEVPSNHY
jgi:hypothetical protein